MNNDFSEVDFELTEHAKIQSFRRGISELQVCMAIKFGRKIYDKGARKYVVGKKEVKHAQKNGVDLQDISGIHVVCCTDINVVITVFRNQNLKRSLRKKRKSYFVGGGRSKFSNT